MVFFSAMKQICVGFSVLSLYETSGLIGTGTERGKVKPGYGTYILNSL
jgi:hypothetical protein